MKIREFQSARSKLLREARQRLEEARRSAQSAQDGANRAAQHAEAAREEVKQLERLFTDLEIHMLQLEHHLPENPTPRSGEAPKPLRNQTWSVRFSAEEKDYIARTNGGVWSPAHARDLALKAPPEAPANLPDFPLRATRSRTSMALSGPDVAYLDDRASDAGAPKGETPRSTVRRLALWGAAQALQEREQES